LVMSPSGGVSSRGFGREGVGGGETCAKTGSLNTYGCMFQTLKVSNEDE
jgi:hypothetical protein